MGSNVSESTVATDILVCFRPAGRSLGLSGRLEDGWAPKSGFPLGGTPWVNSKFFPKMVQKSKILTFPRSVQNGSGMIIWSIWDSFSGDYVGYGASSGFLGVQVGAAEASKPKKWPFWPFGRCPRDPLKSAFLTLCRNFGPPGGG